MGAVANAVYTPNQCSMMALHSITPKKTWSGKRPCIVHMRMIKSIIYAMLPDERRCKLNAKKIKCVFLGYYECMKAFRLMSLKTKQKIHKNKDVVFMEDSGSIRNDLKMSPSVRNEGPTVVVVVVDKSSISPLFNSGRQYVNDNEQVRGKRVAIVEVCEGPVNDDVVIEGFSEEHRYLIREWRPLRVW